MAGSTLTVSGQLRRQPVQVQVQNALTSKSPRPVASHAWSGTRASGGAGAVPVLSSLGDSLQSPSLPFNPPIPSPSLLPSSRVPVPSTVDPHFVFKPLPSISSLPSTQISSPPKPLPTNHPKIYPLFLNLLASLLAPKHLCARPWYCWPNNTGLLTPISQPPHFWK